MRNPGPPGPHTLQADAQAAGQALRDDDLDLVDVLRWPLRRDDPADQTAPTLHAAKAGVEARLQALVEVAGAVSGAHRLTDVLEAAAEHALAATGAASLSISRLDHDRDLVKTLINVGELAPGEVHAPADETYRFDDFPLWRRLFEGEPQLNAIDDPDSDPGQRDLLRELGKESSIGVAIFAGGRVWGELWATTSPGMRRFGAPDVMFLQMIADRIGSAIARSEQFERVAALAYRDPLTDLANRRALQDAVQEALAGPAEREVTLLVCDVDGLKVTNDEFGHEAGDRVLIGVAEALRAAAAVYPDALVSRLGGDEFCVLVLGQCLSAASDVAHDTLSQLRLHQPPVTLSCGAASVRAGSCDATALLRAGDAAQYEAKRDGRGIVCVAEPGAEAPPRWTADPVHGGANRRRFRDRRSSGVQALVHETLALLDGELAQASALDRLDAVVTRLGAMVDVGRWAIGFSAAGTDSLRTLRTTEPRPRHGAQAELRFRTERAWPLADFPLAAQALAMGTGFIVDVDDPHADPAERDLLIRRNYRAVVAAATPAPEGIYLTELFSDDRPLDVAGILPELRLLALAAVTGASCPGYEL